MEFRCEVIDTDSIKDEESTEVRRGSAGTEGRSQGRQWRKRVVAMRQRRGTVGDDARKHGHRVTRHHRLRRDDAEWALLVIEVIVGCGLTGFPVQVHQEGGDATPSVHKVM